MKWRGRRSLVTGGSRGIGRTITEMLAREGVGVALCARGEAGVQEAVAAALAHGAKAPQCGTIAPSVRPQCALSAAPARSQTRPRRGDFVLFHICRKSGPMAGSGREIKWRSTTALTHEADPAARPLTRCTCWLY